MAQESATDQDHMRLAASLKIDRGKSAINREIQFRYINLRKVKVDFMNPSDACNISSIYDW